MPAQVHIIKPNPGSESKRGCCFVTYSQLSEAEAAIKALNGEVVETLSPMPLLVRIADPPRSREDQLRSRAASFRGGAAQFGMLPAWPGTMGYGFPTQAGSGPAYPGAVAASQTQPFFLPSPAGAGAAMMGVIPAPGGYQIANIMPTQFPTQHGDWSEHTDSEGNKYYYNSSSNLSQWEPPPGWPTQQQQAQVQPVVYPCALPRLPQRPVSGGRHIVAASTRRDRRYFLPQGNGGPIPSVPSAVAGAATGPANTGRRGPKGANLAIFCIPNAYSDADLLVRRSPWPASAAAHADDASPTRAPGGAQEIAKPFGTVVYAQVSRHRDTGLSRGYGFVSFETVEAADRAIAGIHRQMVQGRALRVEKVKADEEPPRR